MKKIYINHSENFPQLLGSRTFRIFGYKRWNKGGGKAKSSLELLRDQCFPALVHREVNHSFFFAVGESSVTAIVHIKHRRRSACLGMQASRWRSLAVGMQASRLWTCPRTLILCTFSIFSTRMSNLLYSFDTGHISEPLQSGLLGTSQQVSTC